MITFQVKDVELPYTVNTKLITWINQVIENHNYKCGSINYLFCNDDYILQINRNFLQHDYFTDIITFDNTINGIISGDLIISLDTVKSNSLLFSCDYFLELHRVIIHGVLHMIGFNDASEAEKTLMRKEEDKALRILSTFQ